MAEVATLRHALDCLESNPAALVVTHVDSNDREGIALCITAKQQQPAVTVLMTTPDLQIVPDLLTAGCDGILLEPYAPNLLYNRIGRLVLECVQPRAAKLRGAATAGPLTDTRLGEQGTNRLWPDQECPRCGVKGITSFEFHSRRRAWHACTRCRHVWLGPRLAEW